MIVCDNCNVCVTKNSFCSDKCRVAYHRNVTVTGEKVNKVKDQILERTPKISVELDPQEQEEIMEGLESSEPKPMCEMPFCKVRSEGRYKFTGDAGETEWTKNLCTYHWNKARKEGEVSEQ